MKKFCTVIAALAVIVSCQKPQSEEEKKAEVEKQVQERLAAEHQTEEQQRLAQQQADLEAREKALADKEAAAATATVPEATPLETETVRRNRDTSETSERRSTASYGTFYRKLEPYGAWRETSDYGYVWQPREAEESRSWRPYTDGRWVYTDAGWTWISEEPFGWATYHYGRWVRLQRVGWVWVPGEEWAPAWVSWRTSKDYVGWAPLPPEARFDRKHGIRNWADNYYDIGPDQYAFVPGNEFGSRRIQSSVVPVERNVTIVIETTNVTNITYSNTTVVNQGPNYEEMRSRSQQPIERYRLQRRVEMNGETAKPIVRGEVLEMPAPVITTEPGLDRPQIVKETLTQATVEKTWAADTDHAAAERARAKMKAEVTPPPDAPSKTFVKPESTSVASSPTATAAVAAASPIPASTPIVTVSATPIPSATARATAAAVSKPPPSASASPSPSARTTATARPAATSISTPTPSVAASPSATSRRPSPTHPPRLLPSSTVAPAASALPEATVTSPTPPAISTPSGTPDRAAQLRRSAAQTVEAQRKLEEMRKAKAPPEPKPSPTAVSDASLTPGPSLPRIIPRRSPAPLPSATERSESVAKPLPTYSPPTPPVVIPRSTPPPPVVAPPRSETATEPNSRAPGATRRIAPPPTSDVPAKPPTTTTTSPSPPTASNAKPNNKKPRRPGQVEGEQPTPSPTTAPQ